MNCFKPYTVIANILLWVSLGAGQTYSTKWYFGTHAGLDFSTSPPTVIASPNLNTTGGMSSITDTAGNLLFYTDGSTIWNSQHQVMANRTGLFSTRSFSKCCYCTQC